MKLNKIYNSDAAQFVGRLPTKKVDLVLVDPPYGIEFMDKDWDRAIPDTGIWREIYRALKPGAFAVVMSIPRFDCLWRMGQSLSSAGFDLSFTPIFWAYRSGFPKGTDIAQKIDRHFGVERDILKPNPNARPNSQPNYSLDGTSKNFLINAKYRTIATSPLAKRFDGSNSGFQPKPAVEVCAVAMKPIDPIDRKLLFKTLHHPYWVSRMVKFDHQQKRGRYERMFKIDVGPRDRIYWVKALDPKLKDLVIHWHPKRSYDILREEPYQNSDMTSSVTNAIVRGKGISWIKDCVLPTSDDLRRGRAGTSMFAGDYDGEWSDIPKGPNFADKEIQARVPANLLTDDQEEYFGEFFEIGNWWDLLCQFLIVPKPTRAEKDKGCDGLVKKRATGGGGMYNAEAGRKFGSIKSPGRNNHPTVKPLKLMSWLIMMFSHEGDVVVDPYCGSGTTCVSAKMLRRKWVGNDIDPHYVDIATRRLAAWNAEVDLRKFRNDLHKRYDDNG